MKLKRTAQKIAWSAQDALGDLSDRLRWRSDRLIQRSSDSARQAIGRAGEEIVDPVVLTVRRKFFARLVWPLSDALRYRSDAARTAVATVAVVAAGLAAIAGAQIGSGGPSAEGPVLAVAAPAKSGAPMKLASVTPEDLTSETTLKGVRPDFSSSPDESDDEIEDRKGEEPKTATEAQAADTAKRFANAFVKYEVGESSDQTAVTFLEVSTPTLARSLVKRPPRLPEGEAPPKARVLNVLVGERDGKKIAISVALERLEAVSEIRLNLKEADHGERWVVSEVLG